MKDFTGKAAIKAYLGYGVRAAWPAVETLSRVGSQCLQHGIEIRWTDTWDRTLDEALEALPLVQNCPRDLYRELVQPTAVPKRHALVSERGVPLALISLRRRKRYWEPVPYGSIPGAIAPATELSALGRALNALGVEVRVPAGLDTSAHKLDASHVYAYDVYQVDLKGDYEAHWRKKKHLSTVRRARARCADMQCRIDGDGDIEWTIDQWQRMWADAPDQAVVGAEDRTRFFGALAKAPPKETQMRVHTVQLLAGSRRVAGAVHLCRGDTVLFQCIARDLEFEDSWVGTRVIDASIEWAVANGFACFDLAGGAGYKRWWGPPSSFRHGAIFRSPIFNALYRLSPD
jgi:hypothetical protein